MVVKSVTRASSDRENWDKVFTNLVKILQTKQEEIESLLKHIKSIDAKLKTEHENWISDVRNYEEQLFHMKSKIETMKKMQFAETSKFNFLSVSKAKDLSFCNLKLEQTLDELKHFKAWFDFLTMNTSKETSNSEAAESLEAKIKKLKLEYEKLASQKKSEVSDLVREKGFAWSQFECIESRFTDKLKRKDDEIAQGKTRISSLVSHQEQLESSNREKDEIISNLKAKVAEMEGEFRKKDGEIEKLARELECLKKSRSFTPVLTRCTTRGSGKIEESQVARKKEKSASPPNEKEIRSSKRKRVNKTTVTVSETPKLFTSTFRLPKLKSPSFGAI